MKPMINSHVHIDFENLAPIAEDAVVVVPSIGAQNWTDVQMYPYFALGIHPWFVQEHRLEAALEHLEYLIKCNNPVAIGECGLDYAKDIDKPTQLAFFIAQLKLAEKYDLPVIIHAVKATEDVIFLLKKHPKVRGEIHGFSGSLEQANTLVKMGFYLGFGLQVSNQQSTKIRQIATQIPLENLLLETDDAPNPNDLRVVANHIAELRQIPVEKLIQQCDNNAISLFGLN